MAVRRLTRSRTDRKIAGVCAGLARRFGITPTTMRVIAIASCLLPGPQVLAYVALWVIMPEATYAPGSTSMTKYSVDSIGIQPLPLETVKLRPSKLPAASTPRYLSKALMPRH